MKTLLQLFIFILISLASAETILQLINSLYPSILYENTKAIDCEKLTCYSDRYKDVIGWDNKYDPNKDGIRPKSNSYNHTCGASFGGSFVWSNDVDAGSTFSALLSKKLNCNIDNYGVGGYSFAQAFKKYELYKPSGYILIFNLNRLELLASLSGSSYSTSGKKVINPRPYYIKDKNTFNLKETPLQRNSTNLKNHLAKDYYLGFESPKFPLFWNIPNHNINKKKRLWSWKDVGFLDIPIFKELFNHINENIISNIKGHSIIIINTYPKYLTELNISKLEEHIDTMNIGNNICFSLPGRDLKKAITKGKTIKGKSGHFNETGESIIALNIKKAIENCGPKN